MSLLTRPRRAAVAATTALVLALSLTACGEDEPAQPGAPGELTRVSLMSASGGDPNLVLFPWYVFINGDYDASNGINASIKRAASAQAAAALVAGSDQFSLTSFSSTLTAIASGLPLVIVGAYTLQVPSVIVSKKSVTSFAQLEGKQIIAASLGNTSQTAVVAYAQATGLADPSKLQFIASGSTANSVQYLAAGQGDAGWVQIDQAPKLLAQNPDLHILVNEEKMSAAVGTIGGVVVTTRDYASKNPEIVTKVMKGIIESNRKLYSDEAYLNDMVEGAFPEGTFSEAELKDIYPRLQLTYAVNGGMDTALVEKTYNIWKNYFDPESAKKATFTDGASVVDASFVAEALRQLGGTVEHPVDSGDMASS